MKKFFSKIKIWWGKHKPSNRRLIQLYAFLLYNANIKGIISGNIYTGDTKYACVPGLNCYSCPGAVGACPLGALQNSLASAKYRTPYYVVGIIVLFGLLLGRTICGFLCPVGMGQELLYKIKTPKLQKSRVTRVLSYFKYVLLLVLVVAVPLAYAGVSVAVPGFCKYVCPAGTLGGAVGLLINPNNQDMFSMLGPLFTWKFCLLVVFCVASVFIFRFFCRFFCPLGALYGFFNKFSFLGITVEQHNCTNCGLCVAHCKMDVQKVGDHECINCGECIGVCPTNAICWKGSGLFAKEQAAEGCAAMAQLPNVSGSVVACAGCASSDSSVVEQPYTPSPQPTKLKPLQQRNKMLKTLAWALALCVLLGALVYYNFVDKPNTPVVPSDPSGDITVGNKVGDRCLDFSLPLYGQEGNFTVSECLGKVTVINYWATWCGPCVQEIPHFEQLYSEHSEQMCVVAIHGTGVTQDVQQFLEQCGWSNYSMLFAQDDAQDTYTAMGGNGALPMTVVLDADGVIVYNKIGGLSYQQLADIVLPLLQ